MPLQSDFETDSHEIDSLVNNNNNPLGMIDATFFPALSKPNASLAERRNAADMQASEMWSDCASTHAVLGTDDTDGCQMPTTSPNFFLSTNLYDLYQDRYIPSSSATHSIDKKNIPLEEEVNDLMSFQCDDCEEELFEGAETYSRSNSIAAFYCDEGYYHHNITQEDEENEVCDLETADGGNEADFNMSFASDVATICSNESVTSTVSESSHRVSYCLDDTVSFDSSSYTQAKKQSYYPPSASDSSSHHRYPTTATTSMGGTPHSFVEQLLQDMTVSSNVSELTDTSSCAAVPFVPSCHAPAVMTAASRTLRSGLMPLDPTTKYRKLIRQHGVNIVSDVDLSALYEDHILYVSQLCRANADLTPSPFPFHSELKQQQNTLSLVVHRQAATPSVQYYRQQSPQVEAAPYQQHGMGSMQQQQPRPLQFLPPPPPSMQTYFVVSHTFGSSSQSSSKFPASELHTKPGTGNWSAGFGPEYAATTEDGLPADREQYDPTSEAFTRFYEVLMRWYNGVCRAQATTHTGCNPLIATIKPVPPVEGYSADFIGWVRDLSKWWDSEVKPKTGSLPHTTISHVSIPANMPQRCGVAAITMNETMKSVPRSLAPPPLMSTTTQTQRPQIHQAGAPASATDPIVAVSSYTPAATHRAKPNILPCSTSCGDTHAPNTDRCIW